MSHTVRIDGKFIKPIDEAVETLEDEFGRKKFRTRKDFIDSSVYHYLKEVQAE